MKENNKSFIDKCIKDSEGNVAIAQKPNLPLIVWLVCLVIQFFVDGKLSTLVDYIGFGAIFTWAWLEIFQGSNYFRRAIGVLAMSVVIYSRVY